MIFGNGRNEPISGKLTLLAGLTAVLISGCSPGLQKSSYVPTIPILQARPLKIACDLGSTTDQCTCLTTSDYQQIVRKLKASCLALGGTEQDCQAIPPDEQEENR